MDSRIREIEQWVAEAKEDLGECGQEAYIRKLYLLDAEIRAIIRDNGILPGVTSPQRQQTKHVRRFKVPALAASGVLSVLLLAATTVYFTQPAIFGRTPASLAPGRVVAGFVPSAIEGELILADNGDPLNLPPNLPQGSLLADVPFAAQSQAVAGSMPAGLETGSQTAVPLQPAGGVLLASSAVKPQAPAGSKPNGGYAATAQQRAMLGGGEETIDVVLGYLPQPAAPGLPPSMNNSSGTASVGFDGLVPQVARLEFTERFTVPDPSEERVNSVKTQLDPRGARSAGGKKDAHDVHVDKSTEVPVDNVDNSDEEESVKGSESTEQGAK